MPWGPMYVNAASRNPIPWKVMSLAGRSCVALKFTSIGSHTAMRDSFSGGPFASSSSASGIDWSKGDVGWSTWNVRRLRPLRDFTQETLQQQIVSNIERAGGYKIFIPSPGVHKTHTYRIDACTFTTHKYVHDTDPRTIVDMTTSGVLYVDSGPAIELYGADYTSPNVRITHQDGFVSVFIPLKESATALPSGPDLVSVAPFGCM